MKKILILHLLLIAGIGFANNPTTLNSEIEKATPKQIEPNHMAILWTSGEKDVFIKVVYMYSLNSKKYEWWEKVTLIVWGPSSKLLGSNMEMQEKIKELIAAGVEVVACKWCSDEYGVSDKFVEIGIDVKYMGKPLTGYLKEGVEVMVF